MFTLKQTRGPSKRTTNWLLPSTSILQVANGFQSFNKGYVIILAKDVMIHAKELQTKYEDGNNSVRKKLAYATCLKFSTRIHQPTAPTRTEVISIEMMKRFLRRRHVC